MEGQGMKSYTRDVRRAFLRAGLIRRESRLLASFAIGTGVGILAGAALALLVTPRSGPEMRRELGTRAKRLAQRTSGALGEVKENVQARMKSGRHGEEAQGSLEEVYRAQ
jgi:gas vesicle protein